jgi:hypothetical protein
MSQENAQLVAASSAAWGLKNSDRHGRPQRRLALYRILHCQHPQQKYRAVT